MSFDMASREQAEYIEIDGVDLLKESGSALIKCSNDEILCLQAPLVTNKEINNVIRSLGKNKRGDRDVL